MWVLICAGEASGDRYAAPIVQRLSALRPELRFFGAGGPALSAANVELRHSIDSLAVTGISEALRRAGPAARLFGDLWWQVHRRRPHLALLVDYPGVNLRLAGMLRRAGVPVVYFIAPQRWAWLESRTRLIADRVNRLAVTLPFEQAFFGQRGVDAQFVGHPARDLFRAQAQPEARAALGLDVQQRVLALLPGSRDNELQRHLPLVRAAARLLSDSFRPVLVTLCGRHAARCRELAPELQQGSAEVALGAADVALCAAGTATIETAIAGVPAVVFYRMSRLTGEVARRLVRVPSIALPNLVLGDRLLPELVQQDATPERLARAARELVEPTRHAQVRHGLARVVDVLGEGGYADKVARMALPLLPRAGG